jgi:hypothetical protein
VTAAAADPPEAAGGWPLVVALAVAQVVSWGSIYYSFSLFVVPMESELGWSRTALNGALSCGLLISGIFAYSVGAWIDARGGRALMALGSALATGLLLAWSRLESLAALYAVWVGLGLAMAATLYEPAFAVITRTFPLSYRRRITALTLIGGFASTVFIPLTQLFIETLGWRGALVALGLCNGAIALPIHALWLQDRGARDPASSLATDRRRAAQAMRRALASPVFWGLAVCFFFYNATFSALTFHLVPLLSERGLPMALIIGALATIGPAQVAGRILLVALGRVPTALVGRLIVLVFPASVLLLVLFPSSAVGLFAFTLLYGGANGVMTIVRGLAVPDLMWREGYGAINGALTLPSNVARALAPFGAAVIWGVRRDYGLVLWSIVVGASIAALGFWYAAAATDPVDGGTP